MILDGKQIQNERKLKKLTQKDLAIKLNISSKYLSDIETGRRNPSKSLLKKIIQVLGLRKSDYKNIEDTEINIKNKKRSNLKNVKNKNNVLEVLLNKIVLLEKENEKLKNCFNNIDNILVKKGKDSYSKSYNNKLKENAFRSDFETTTKIIPLLWKLRDETTSIFSELELLLEINSNYENVKMEKGLKKVGRDLIEMGEKIIKYSEKNIIIDMEDYSNE